ncbi:MAG: pyridoxal-phosphate dependent enzyme [Nitrososphaeraceae archaeon]
MQTANKKCINPHCGLTYDTLADDYVCGCGYFLDVQYLKAPKRELIDRFYHRRNHGGNIYDESGVWRFRDLINFVNIDCENFTQCATFLVSLDGAEGRLSKPYKMTKVAEYAEINPDSLLLQPEGYNPSGSFKDNGMATAVTHAKMLKVRNLICASTGNTSASAAMYAANERMDCSVYIPRGEVAPGKLGQAFQFGAHVIEVNGNFDDALSTSLKAAQENGGYTVNSINPFRIEGQKTIIYRVLENLNWSPPDWIFYPGGALGNIASCGKCLMELYGWGWIKKIPRLVVVNSEGANTFYELVNGLFEGKNLSWNNGRPDLQMINRYYEFNTVRGKFPKTQATAIQIGRPANIVKALRALDFTNGIVVQVNDKEMADGMSVVGLNGFDCEMASGSVPAAVKKLIHDEVIGKDDVVVGILTGRQKDPQLVVNYHLDSNNIFANPPSKTQI